MYFLSIIVLCFLFLQTFGRPTHVLQDYDKDSRDSSYRDIDNGETDDYQHDDHKASFKQFSDEPAPKSELDENSPGTNEEIGHGHPDKDYLENSNGQDDEVHLSQSDVSSDMKRTPPHDNGILLFHEETPHKIETNEYNEGERVRPSHNNRYLKQYHTFRNTERDTLVRDRRQIKNNDLNDPISTDDISTQKNDFSANENEETAIRRHIKKLSKEELDELLHSLSEDKRALLKNIIDSPQEYGDINKREITKKAGANEENSLVGNEQSDTSKIQGGSENLEAESSIAPNSEKEADAKKADSESMYSKSPETSNSSEKCNDKTSVSDSITDKIAVKSDSIENLDLSNTESKILTNSETEKETQKKENKREIDLTSSVESESIVDEPTILKSNREDLYCSDNEALAQLWNEESNLHNDNKYKRDVCSDNIASIKSLEESFPNVDDTNNLNIEADMAPVRVKRDNPEKEINERDENFASNLKDPYFSSALENNDEENDEGGEFQSDGFFDRGANFAKSGELAKRGIEMSKGSVENNRKYCMNSPSLYTDKNKLATDNAGLGSDTDVVVSGIEGVDDNVMYNGVARIRRTGSMFDRSNMGSGDDKLRQGNTQQINSHNENNEISEENYNAAHYQENDAFGPLPRNYEQDLGRFKRIRRLKPENAVTV